MNKTLLVVFVVVLAIGAIFWMNASDSDSTSAPEPAPQKTTEADEDTVNADGEEEVTEVTPEAAAPAAPAAPTVPVTTVADVDKTLSDIDALLEPAYDDSSLDSEVNGGFDEMNNAYAF